LNPALAAWGVEIGLITIRDLTGPARRFPLPSELLSTFIVFGALAAAGGTATGRRPAGAVAWGLVVATFLGMATSKQPGFPGTNLPIIGDVVKGGSGQANVFSTVAGFLAPSGSPQTAPAAASAPSSSTPVK
jgi:hypothetical protein